MTISLSMCLTSQPLSTNSTASASSNSGCVGRFALAAEIVQRAGDAAAEAQIPEPIDHHAGRQPADALLGVGQPVGQVEPRGAAAAGSSLPRNAGIAGLDDLAAVVEPVAARQNANRRAARSPR